MKNFFIGFKMAAFTFMSDFLITLLFTGTNSILKRTTSELSISIFLLYFVIAAIRILLDRQFKNEKASFIYYTISIVAGIVLISPIHGLILILISCLCYFINYRFFKVVKNN